MCHYCWASQLETCHSNDLGSILRFSIHGVCVIPKERNLVTMLIHKECHGIDLGSVLRWSIHGVKFSLEAATSAQSNASNGIYDASAVSSRQARALAEDAFFHPSIMSLSYSSIEHYFAIYMPFFAPVTLHVLLAAVKEVKRYWQEGAKYLAWTRAQAS